MRPESRAGKAFEVRQTVQGEVNLHRHAFDLECFDGLKEFALQVACLDKLQESPFGVHTGHHDLGADFLAALQHDSGSAAIADQHFLDASFGSDFRTPAARGVSHGLCDAAHTSPDKAPQPTLSAYAPHAVMHEDIGGAGRAGTTLGSDYAIGG